MTDQQAPSFRSPTIFIPFILVILIWGSTWIVIKDQLHVVPAAWSVTYRFVLGGIVMLGVAAISRAPMRLDRKGHQFAALLGIAQFTSNFNFVYEAERYITSGIVAVVFALLFLPNAILARIFLGQQMSGRFIAGSLVSIIGLIVLFINEAQSGAASVTATLTGIGLTLGGIMSASISNVMQATERSRSLPLTATLGWAMLYGAFLDGLYALTIAGPPVFEMRLGYVAGLLYLGIVASAVAFSLYSRTIRDIGPAKAAYSSVVIPVLAMGLSTMFEDYRWSGLAIIGSAIALVGMVIALSGKEAGSASDG